MTIRNLRCTMAATVIVCLSLSFFIIRYLNRSSHNNIRDVYLHGNLPPPVVGLPIQDPDPHLGLGQSFHGLDDPVSVLPNDDTQPWFDSLSLWNKSSGVHPFEYAAALMRKNLILELSKGRNLFTDNSQGLKLPGTYDQIQSWNEVNRVSIRIPFDGQTAMQSHGSSNNSGRGAVVNVGDMIPMSKAKKVLIITTWRSGSTFLGDMLSRYPGTFYTYEPLHFLGDGFLDEGKKGLTLLHPILNCSLPNLLYKDMNKFRYQIEPNIRVWNVCSNLLLHQAACFMPEFINNFICPMFPIRLVKLVRMKMKDVMKFLENHHQHCCGKAEPEVDFIKVIFLVRDPRGVMNSRSKAGWCTTPSCSRTEEFCQFQNENLNYAEQIKAKFPDQIILVRYEDLCLDPSQETGRILDFLELQPDPLVDKFIMEHTKFRSKTNSASAAAYQSQDSSSVPNFSAEVREAINISLASPHTTLRNSKATVFAWKFQMQQAQVDEVQKHCSKFMANLGYKSIHGLHEDSHPLDLGDNSDIFEEALSPVWR